MFRWRLALAAAGALASASATMPATASPAPPHIDQTSQARSSGSDGVIVSTRFNADVNEGRGEIVAVSPEDGSVRVLTTGSDDGSPDVSPDGRFIVFNRCPGTADCGDSDQPVRLTIWMMRADGSDQRELFTCDPSLCLGAFDPAFSADGQLVTFAQDRLGADGVNVNGIFTMQADGSAVRRVTSNVPDVRHDFQPHFSPDGRSIVFQRGDVPDVHLMIVNTDGTGLRSLLPDRNGADPSWAPNGQRIAFTLINAEGGFTVKVATVRPDGSGLKVLTDSDADNRWYTPDYSPNGARLVFFHGTPADPSLVITNPNGQGARFLPRAAGDFFFQPSWGVQPAQGH